MFTLMFALALVAIVVPGVAADDIMDFIGKSEQPTCEQWTSGEQSFSRSTTGSLESYSSGSHRENRVEGARLETRFDLAPALHGGTNNLRLQPGIHGTQQVAYEQASEAQDAPQEIEPVLISEHIPPPHTGREAYLRWGALGGLILLCGLLPVLRKKVRS